MATPGFNGFLISLDCKTGDIKRYQTGDRRVWFREHFVFNDWEDVRRKEGEVTESLQLFRKYGARAFN